MYPYPIAPGTPPHREILYKLQIYTPIPHESLINSLFVWPSIHECILARQSQIIIFIIIILLNGVLTGLITTEWQPCKFTGAASLLDAFRHRSRLPSVNALCGLTERDLKIMNLLSLLGGSPISAQNLFEIPRHFSCSQRNSVHCTHS